MRYPIYLNYEMDKSPIGFVEIENNVSKDIIRDGAIVPYLVKDGHEGDFITAAFGLVKRTTVNTKPGRLV